MDKEESLFDWVKAADDVLKKYDEKSQEIEDRHLRIAFNVFK